jgi:hypothetical protein
MITAMTAIFHFPSPSMTAGLPRTARCVEHRAVAARLALDHAMADHGHHRGGPRAQALASSESSQRKRSATLLTSAREPRD